MSKNQTTQPGPAQGSAPMDVDVNIYRPSAQGPVLADASVTIGGCFAIRGVKIKEGKNGPFVSMPSRIVNGEYKDVCFPCTSSSQAPYHSLPGKARKLTHCAAPPLRGRPASLGSATIIIWQQFDQAVLGAYQQAMDQSLQQRQGQGQSQESYQEQEQSCTGPAMSMGM